MDLRILFCAPEVAPYAKTGGLADVAGSLPPALQQLGCDVRIFMPLYRTVRETLDGLELLAEDIPIPVGVHDYHVHLWRSRTRSGVPIYFLEKDELFDRANLYGTPARGDYEDNAERYITFCRAVRALCIHLGWFPSIFHLHDWQSGLVSAYFSLNWRYSPQFIRSGTVFTIHNLAYQGIFPANRFSLTQLPPEAFSMGGMEFWGQCNFMKAALVYSDFLTTVSPTYAKEIQTHAFGYGLDGLLRDRRDDLAGILNGIDPGAWDPETDPELPANYSSRDLTGKIACKKALIAEAGLPPEALDRPLLGMIGRFAVQKGFDLFSDALDELMTLRVSIIILGTGDAAVEESLRAMESLFPSRLKLITEFNEGLAHRIEAGADIFLMPSRYEPCGLNQMYSLRYGTVPVVHATGGLEDSVVDVIESPEAGTGFKFREFVPEAFIGAVKSALDAFAARQRWTEIQRRGMAQDFSWTRSARAYIDIYEKMGARRRRIGTKGEKPGGL